MEAVPTQHHEWGWFVIADQPNMLTSPAARFFASIEGMVPKNS